MADLICKYRIPFYCRDWRRSCCRSLGVCTVQPIVTFYVQELVGPRQDLATLSGIAFSVTGLANVIAAPFFCNRSDRIVYRGYC